MEKTATTIQPLKVDRTRLKTIKSYALMKGVHTETVRRWVNEKKVKTVEIDGVVFVEI